jgi:hypothetical protein
MFSVVFRAAVFHGVAPLDLITYITKKSFETV